MFGKSWPVAPTFTGDRLVLARVSPSKETLRCAWIGYLLEELLVLSQAVRARVEV
jgi:hypothetical protein